MKSTFNCMCLFILFFTTGLEAKSQFAKSDLLNRWAGAMNVEKRSSLADEIIFEYRHAPKKVIDSVSNQLDIAAEQSEQYILDWNHYVKSQLEKGQSNFVKSTEHLDTSIELTETPFLYIKSFSEKAKVHTILSELDEAFKCFDVALRTSKQSDHYQLQAEIFATLGEFSRKTGEFEKGLKYLDSAQNIVDKYDIYGAVNIDILDRKAALHSQLGNLDSMVNYSYIALEMAYDQQNKHAQAVSHNELGYYYEHVPNDDSSYYHYQKAIDIWNKTGAYRYLSNAQFNMARVLMKNKRLNESIDLLFNTEKMCEGREWYEVYPRLYEHIALVYQNRGDSANYYKYKSKAIQSSYDLYRTENEKKLIEIRYKYEQDKNLAIIENQKSELALKESNLDLEHRQRNQVLLFLGIASILLLVSLYLLVKSYRNRKKLAAANASLETTINAKDALIKEVHHRVKNNFQMISSLLTLQSKAVDDEDVKSAFAEAQSRIHSMALVHQKLYYGESYDYVNIKDFIAEVLFSLTHSDLRSQDIFQLESETYFVHIEQAIPLGIIIHELATNSLKHAWDNTATDKTINLKFNKDGGKFILNYRDNGKGLPEGFSLDSASSLGLKLIDLFINRQLNGNVNFHNDNGAVFEFSFELRNEQ